MDHEDLELGGTPIGRKTSWVDRVKPARRSSTLVSIPMSRALTFDAQVFASLPSLTAEEAKSRDCLISFIIGDEVLKGSLAIACSWYARFLQRNFNSYWHLLAPVLEGLVDTTIAPRPGDLVFVFDFVLIVAQQLKKRERLALSEIVDELYNDNKVKDQLDEERAKPNQIVWAALGWLTMLFEPVAHPKADKLEVTKTSTSSCGKSLDLDTRKFYSFRQSFEYNEFPLYNLIGRFGDLIPEARVHLYHHPGLSLDPSNEVIVVQSVCFQTLQTYAGLKIEWVSALALHLELDSGKKTLKLFQFPSFCRMILVQKRNSVLSRMLNDQAARNCEDVNLPEFPIDEFFKEILLSYRLIFGQDERSWKAFHRMVATWDQNNPGDTAWATDPLLLTLCGKSATSDEAEHIYEEIEANEPVTYYDPRSEFPFFGKKLMELQRFVKQHQPQNLRSLLSDRRDVHAWYTLWSNQLLVFFATFTILVMLVSLLFQIWQVILAKQQLRQGSGPNSS